MTTPRTDLVHEKYASAEGSPKYAAMRSLAKRLEKELAAARATFAEEAASAIRRRGDCVMADTMEIAEAISIVRELAAAPRTPADATT